MSPGAYFITFTKGLSSDKFKFSSASDIRCRGPATVFIHRRLNEDGTSVSGSLTEIADDESHNEARGAAPRVPALALGHAAGALRTPFLRAQYDEEVRLLANQSWPTALNSCPSRAEEENDDEDDEEDDEDDDEDE